MKIVSTHSRPKAAGVLMVHCNQQQQFQHTAARRRLVLKDMMLNQQDIVSTHSRPKAAGKDFYRQNPIYNVSTHSRPKAAGYGAIRHHKSLSSFNTQPPEGGWD